MSMASEDWFAGLRVEPRSTLREVSRYSEEEEVGGGSYKGRCSGHGRARLDHLVFHIAVARRRRRLLLLRDA